MKPNDEPTTADDQLRSADETELRQQAVKRSWICPGAGFALVGSGAWAVVTFVVSLCIVPAVAWLVFQPAPASLWATIAVLIIATVFWLVEQIAINKVAVRAPSPAVLDRGYILSACVVWLAVILTLGLLFSAFGSLVMAGSGMTPTLEKSERLVYYKRVDWQSVKPGAVIVYKNANDSAWGQPGWIVISRILAGPGDDISIQDGNYLVNGAPGPPVAAAGEYPVALEVPSSPETLTVPDDSYFIVQDSPARGFDSRVLSWVRAENILGSRMWYLSRRGIGKPVE